jgi:hypothetical protein
MKFVVTAVPCLIMLIITSWAIIRNEIGYFRRENWLLVTIGGVIFLLALWMTIEAVTTFFSRSPTKEQPAQA